MPTLSLNEAQALEPGTQMRDWAYNALDCTGTLEVAHELLPRLTEAQARMYAFEKALQAPAMSMMLRGVRIDQYQRNEVVKELRAEMRKDERRLAKMPGVGDKWDGVQKETGWCPASDMAKPKRHKWPKGVPDHERQCERCGTNRLVPVAFSATSPIQTQHLLFDLHSIPVHKNKKDSISTDDEVLHRIAKRYPEVGHICDAILAIRDYGKQLGSLSAKLTSNGRYPSSFNVGATWTGRFSSSKNPYGLGGNLQNVAPRHRRIFIADPGYNLGYSDYMQGESNIVAHLSGDPKYIEAHRLGDVHTYVTRFVWPELPWTGDLAQDKKIAKQNPPWDEAEGHDYRFQCKRIQHGSNYGMSPYGISRVAQIPLAQAKQAYERYMGEFDRIPAWQAHVKQLIMEHRPLVNPLGRPAQLIGRPWDEHTHKQGLAFLPQSCLADINDIALWQVWYYLEEQGVQLLAQVHDALLHQYPEGRLDLERELLKCMSIPVPVTDIGGVTRIMTIGVESAIGKNWGHKSKDNPNGIDEAPIAQYMREHPLDVD